MEHQDKFKTVAGNRIPEINKWIKECPDGNIAEFGCGEGGMTLHLAKFGRIVWTFDTFEGIPEEDFNEELDKNNPPGKFKPTFDIVNELEKYNNILPIKGRYEYTLKKVPPYIKFAFAFVDCDLYKSYKEVLKFLYMHMKKDGIALIDDCTSCKGARKAVKEFCEKHNKTFENDIIRF